MRRTASGVAAMAAAALVVSACSSGDDTAESTTDAEAADVETAGPTGGDDAPAALLPADIRDAGVLNVGNSPVYPPMSYLPEDEEDESARIGFDIDLGTAIAERLGLEVNWITQPYEQYIPSLATGRIDIIHSAMQDLEERRETVDFVDYYTTGPQLFTMADRAGDFTTETDVCGSSVVVDSGDAGYRDAIADFSETECAAAGLEPVEEILADSTADALLQLDQGRAAASIRGAESIRYVVNEQEPGTYALIGSPIAEIPVGIGVDKENTELRDAIAAALGELMADGTYAEIGETWGLADILRDTVTINDAEVG